MSYRGCPGVDPGHYTSQLAPLSPIELVDVTGNTVWASLLKLLLRKTAEHGRMDGHLHVICKIKMKKNGNEEFKLFTLKEI